MKNNKVLLLSILLISFMECKSSKGKILLENKIEPIFTDIIIGKVKSIEKHKDIQEVLILKKDESLCKILTLTTKKLNFLIGNNYKVKTRKLLTINLEPKKMIINNKEVIIRPNLAIENCIYFYKQKFCETSLEIYEGIELAH